MRAGPNFLTQLPIVAGSKVIEDKCKSIDTEYIPLPLGASKCEYIPLDADCCVYLVDLIVTFATDPIVRSSSSKKEAASLEGTFSTSMISKSRGREIDPSPVPYFRGD